MSRNNMLQHPVIFIRVMEIFAYKEESRKKLNNFCKVIAVCTTNPRDQVII